MGNSAISSLLVKSAAWDLGIQWSLFLVATLLKTEKFYDLAGSGTFLLLAVQTLRWGGTFFLRQRIQTALVSVWATRLGLYLFSRVLSDGFDRRFNKAKNQPSLFFVFWTVQAVWIFLTLSPTIALNGIKKDSPLCARDYIGWGTWAVGFLMEVMADRQKSIFRANPDNAGKFINTGLWSISRHPNYFGEILCWLGLYISASTSLTGWQHLTAVSPIFVTLLLTKVSGIPLLEKYGMKKWGNDLLYQTYLRKTAVLIPFLWPGDSKKKNFVRLNSNGSSESAQSGVNNGFVYQLKKKESNADEEVESDSSKDVKDAKKCNGSLVDSSLNEEIPEDAPPAVESVICTACCNQIDPFEKNAFFGHPVLNVVFCKGCVELYNSCPWKEDEDGIEEDCRWCGQGGSLSVCDFCCMTFCRRCIMCNLGKVELDRTFSKEKWKCYKCEPAPLKELVAKCNALSLRCAVEMERKRHGTNSADVSVNEPDAQDKPDRGEGKGIVKKDEMIDVEKESESEENLHKKAKKVRKSAEMDPTSRDQPLCLVSSSDEESDAKIDSCSGLKRKSHNRKSKKIDTDDDLAASESDDVPYEKPKRKRVMRSQTASSSEESSVELKKPKKRGARREKSGPLLLIEISTSSEDEEDEDTSKKKKGKKAKAASQKNGKATKKRRKKIDTDDDFVASESDDVSYEKPKRKRGGRGKEKKNEDTRRRYKTVSSSEESSVELKKPKKRRARREEPSTSSEADSGQETKSKKRGGRGNGKKWRRINETSDSESEEDTDDDLTSSESDDVSDEKPKRKRGGRGKGKKWRRINEASDSESEEDIGDDLTSSESDNVSNETPRQKRAMRSESSSLKGKSTPKLPYFP